ncbi:MAG: hypothetical protein B7X00_02095 [Legionella sp. 21-45-4]|nr:MAG: hypothetical protein B7X00_02095 [Legionella sp. 21-45-4]
MTSLKANMPAWTRGWYTGLSGGYIESRDFSGGEFAIRAGYDFGQGHSFELEGNFMFEKAGSQGLGLGEGTGSFAGLPVAVQFNRSVDLDMYPIMINYRYQRQIVWEGTPTNLLWYFGLGAGVNIMHSQYTYSQTVSAIDLNANPVPVSGSATASTTQAAPAGQFFLGLGYKLWDCVSLTAGGRFLVTESKQFGPNSLSPNYYGNPLPVQSDLTG